MGFTYDHQRNLIYTLSKADELDTLSLGMLTHNSIPGLAAATFIRTGDSRYIKYDVAARTPVSRLLRSVINRKTLIGILRGIVDAVLSAEDYILDTDQLLFDEDRIFVDEATAETVLIYLPASSKEADNSKPYELIKRILFIARFDQKENCDYVAQIMNYISNHAVFSPTDFKALLDKISKSANAVKPAPPVGLKAFLEKFSKGKEAPKPIPPKPAPHKEPIAQGLYQTLLHGLENMHSRIACSGYSKDRINEVLHQILLDNPQLCHFEGQWHWDGGLVPTYTLTSRQQKALMDEANNVLRQLSLPSGASAHEKAEQVYRWLSGNVTYNREAPHSQSAYGALVERQALCKGIAKAFQLLLRMLHVPCTLVEGTLDGTTKHVWNMYLAGEWYHSDVTMYYPQFQGWNRTGDPMGYLAISTSEILRSHIIWSDSHKATSSEHYNEFFQSTTCSRRKQPHAPLVHLPERMARPGIGQPRYIASGSISDVYRIDYPDRTVAVKQILCGLDTAKLYHAMRECAMMHLTKDCTGTVSLLDQDVVRTMDGFTVFMMQEYFPSLDEFCSHTPPTIGTAVKIAMDICDALEQCWRKGVAHLDIQPGNILISSDGKVKLTDFSSALPVEELATERLLRGTPAYMAPEVRTERRYSQASELYALGIVLYCMLNQGRLPFGDQFPMDKAVEARTAGRPVTLDQQFDRRIRSCVEKACAFRAEDRFQTIQQFRSALAELLDTVPGLDGRTTPSSFTAPATFPRHITWETADSYATSVAFESVSPGGCVQMISADSFGETTVLPPPMPANIPAPPCCHVAPSQPIAPPSCPPPPQPVAVQAPMAQTEPVRISTVQFSALAPHTAIKGEYTLVQLFMYEQAFRSAVEEALQMAEMPMQEKKTGFYQIMDQTRVKVVLSCPDVEIPDDTVEQLWSGGYLVFDFALDIPSDFAKRQTLLKATVYFNDIPATRLMMTLKLQSQHDQRLELLRTDVLSAFVSYASQDRSRVGALVQGMMKARPDMDIFFDINSLRSGENWEKTLRSEIEKRDTLFLCWSKNAQNSQWVDMEWRYALANKGIEAIEPIPIDPPDECPPPEELKSKHFNDSLLYIINRR